MAAYLSDTEAAARLQDRYNITAAPVLGDLEAASGELDASPLVGWRYDLNQEREFPRSVTLAGDVEGEVPEAVLDWVALRAYQLLEDESPAVQSEGARGVNVSYAEPKLSQTEKRMKRLLAPYLAPVRLR